MSASGTIKRALLGSQWSADSHARYCAARNEGSAVFVVALCAGQALLAWRLLRTEFPPLGPISFFVALVVITFGASFFLAYPGFRERFVSSLFVLRGLVGFATFAKPAIAHEFLREIRYALLALWLVGLFLGLTMLAQARARR